MDTGAVSIGGERVSPPGRKGRRLRTFSMLAVFLCMLPGILHYTCFRLAPSITTAVLSFTNISGLPGSIWEFIGWENYREFFIVQNIRDLKAVLGRTAIFASVVTVAQNVFALFFAVILNKKFLKGRSLYRAVIFLPSMLGVTVVSSVWKLMFSAPAGPVFLFMMKILGINNPPTVLGSFQYAFPAVISIQVWMHVGYTMLIYLAGLQGIPNEVYESASIDGANGWQAFWRITLPMISSTVIVNTLICMIGALQTFELIMTLTSGQFNTSTLSMQVFATAFGGRGATAGGGTVAGLRQGYAASQSMVLFVVVFITTVISRKIMSGMESDL